jgi:hypothetical protein
MWSLSLQQNNQFKSNQSINQKNIYHLGNVVFVVNVYITWVGLFCFV